MSRLLSRLRYFVSDALDEWGHSPGVNLVATATLLSALFVAGLVVLVLSNVAGRIVRMRSEAPIEVYLRDDVTEPARAALQKKLEATAGVERVSYVDKEESLKRFRESFGNLADLTGELGANPLPTSFEIVLDPAAESGGIAEGLSRDLPKEEGVEEVRYDRVWLDHVDSLLRLARVGGAGLAVLVFGAVAFVMASVLRLAVYSRRDEIEIMLLVGATPAFVRGPFLVAGSLQGLAASLGSLGLLELVRRSAVGWAGATPGSVIDLVAGRHLAAPLSLLLVGIGLVVGVTGSWFAVKGVRS
jgi:cell division transport system permease protein